MKVKYVGVSLAGVELPEWRLVVAHGEQVDLPAGVVKELVATGEWSTGKNKPAEGEED
jgi:hypothetical protein